MSCGTGILPVMPPKSPNSGGLSRRLGQEAVETRGLSPLLTDLRMS